MSKGACKNQAGDKVTGFDEMLETLLQAMESGKNPWQRPWLLDRPRNATTGIEYRGINALYLSFAAMKRGWTDLRFLTDKQLRERGGEPIQGSGRKSPIAFWKPLEKPAKKLANGKYQAGAKQNKAGEWVVEIWLIREYYVWNIAQVTIDPAKLAKSELATRDIPLNGEAERLVTAMAPSVHLSEGWNGASYLPDSDQIRMPARETFKSQPEYYATLLHEVTHSTGHPSRLGRFRAGDSVIFGSETYSAEELVAEMCAASLVAYCGMEAPVANSAAYLRGWATKLRTEPRQAIMTAASRAQAAYDFLTKPATSTIAEVEEAAEAA